MAQGYADVLRLKVIPETREFASAYKDIAQTMVNDKGLQKALGQPFEKAFTELKGQVNNINTVINTLNRSLSAKADNAVLDGYIQDVQKLDERLVDLVSQMNTFKQALSDASGSRLDNSAIKSFVADLQHLVELSKPLSGVADQLLGIARFSISAKGATIVEKQTAAYQGLEKELKQVDKVLAGLDYTDYEDRLRKRVKNFDTLDASQIVAKLNAYQEQYEASMLKFEDAQLRFNNSLSTGVGMEESLEQMRKFQEETQKAVSGYQLLYEYAKSATTNSKETGITFSKNDLEYFEATSKEMREFTAQYAASWETERGRISDAMTAIVRDAQETGVKVKTALVNLEDGSIKIPLAIETTSEDLYAKVDKIITETNARLSANDRRLRVKIDFQDNNITQKKLKETAENKVEEALTGRQKLDKLLAKASQASEVLEKTEVSIEGMSQAQSLAQLAEALNTVKSSINGLRSDAPETITKISEALDLLIQKLPQLTAVIGKDKIDLQGLATTLGSSRALLYAINNLNTGKYKTEETVSKPKKEKDTFSDDLKSQKARWEEIKSIIEKLSIEIANIQNLTGNIFDRSLISDEQTKVLDNYLDRIRQLYKEYIQLGGINPLRGLADAGIEGVDETDIQNFPFIEQSLHSIYQEVNQSVAQDNFLKTIETEVKDVGDNLTPVQKIGQQIGELANIVGTIKLEDSSFMTFIDNMAKLDNEDYLKVFSEKIITLDQIIKNLAEAFNLATQKSTEFKEGLGNFDISSLKEISKAAKGVEVISNNINKIQKASEQTQMFAPTAPTAPSSKFQERLQNISMTQEEKEAAKYSMTPSQYKEYSEKLKNRIERLYNAQQALSKAEYEITKEIHKLQEQNVKKTGKELTEQELKPLLTKNKADEEAELKRAKETLRTALGLGSTTSQEYHNIYDPLVNAIIDEWKKKQNQESTRHQGAMAQATKAFSERTQKEDLRAQETVKKQVENLRKNLYNTIIKEAGENAISIGDLIKLTDDDFEKQFEGYDQGVISILRKIREEAIGVDNQLNQIDISQINADGLDQAKDKLANCSTEVKKFSADARKADKDIKEFYKVAGNAPPSPLKQSGWEEFFKSVSAGTLAGTKSFARLAAQFITFGHATHGAMMMVRDSMNTGRQAVLEYDKALTTIKYTMDMTDERFNQLGKDTVQMARDLRLSVQDAMTISQIYANMQTTAEEILATGKPTAILSNLSGAGTEAAANYIQSVQQQFDMTEAQAEHIVDVYDKVSASIKMDYAKGISNIAGGVQAAGQVAHDAGLQFEELAAIIGKVTERTREEGAAIGNSLKTIITRISKASKLSGADEVDNETISKAAKALHDVNVEVYESDGTFRNLKDILTELAAVWDSLTDAQRANISYEVAATRQTNKFRAILTAWTDSMVLANQAMETQGNALANQEKYMESMGGLTQGVKTEMETFWLNLYNSDVIKAGLKTALGGAQFLNSVQSYLGPAGTAIGAGLAISIGGGLTGAAKSFIGTALGNVFEGLGQSVAVRAAGTAIGASVNESIAKEIEKSGSSSIARALGSSLAVAGVAAGAVALYGLYAAIKENNKQIEASRAKALENAEAVSKQSEAYSSLADRIRESRDILTDSASTDEQIYTAKSNLYDIQNKLIDTYGEEAKGIDLVNGNLEEQLRLIKELNQEDADSFLNTVQETSWSKRLGSMMPSWAQGVEREKTGRQLANESQDFLNRTWSGYYNQYGNDSSFNYGEVLSTSGLSKDVKNIIAQVFKDAGIDMTNIGDLKPEEYKAALEEVDSSLTDLIKNEYADNTDIQNGLSTFQGRVDSKLTEVVNAILAAQEWMGMLFVSDRDSYNDESKTGGRLYDDIEAELKEASMAYNEAVESGELTKEIEDEFERASNAAKAFAMSSEEAAEEQRKVHQEINDLIRRYGASDFNYNNRKYIKNEDGSTSTIETADVDFYGGKFSAKMATSGMTEQQVDQYIESINESIRKKIASGGKVTLDDIIKEFDKDKLILFGRNGSYEQNKELYEQFEDDIYLLKEYGLELESRKQGTLDTSPAEAYLRQIAENTTGTTAYKRQQAVNQIAQNSNAFDALRGKGYTRVDVSDGKLNTRGDTKAYEYMKQAFEAAGLSVDELNSYLEETGVLLVHVADEAETAAEETGKIFSVSDVTKEIDTIKKVSDAIGGLITSMNEAGDGQGLDLAGLSTVQGTFEGSFDTAELENYIARLNDARGSAEDTTAILKEMMLAWANQSQYLDQSGESFEILKRALEDVGFEIKQYTDDQKAYLDSQWDIIKAHQEQAESADDAAQAILADIDALNAESGALGMTQSEWVNYYVAKFSGTGSFSTAGDQAALLALIGALDGAQAAWIDFYKARADQLKSAKTHGAKMASSGASVKDYQNDTTMQKGIAAAVDSQLKNQGFDAFKGRNTTALTNLNKYSTIGRASRAMNDKSNSQGISDEAMGDLVQAAVESGSKNNQQYVDKQLEAWTNKLLAMDTTGGSATGYAPPSKIDTGKGGSGGSGGSGDKDKDKKDPKELDWIQRRIDLMEKQHAIEQEIASDEKESYAERIASLETLRQQDQFMIEVLKSGAEEYKKTYDEAFQKVKDLAGENETLAGVIGEIDTIEEIREAIESGAIAVDQYDEETYEAIENAIDAWDKYNDQLDLVRQKEKEEHNHLMEELNLRIQEIQEYLSYVQAQGQNVQNELSLIEARGQVVTAGTYKDLIRNSEEQIGLYEEQMSVYEEMLDELDEGSAEYNKTLASIQECANAIQQCELNQIEWNEAIKKIPIKRIEKYLGIIQHIKSDITSWVDLHEEMGEIIGEDTYKQLISLSDAEMKKLEEEKKLYEGIQKDYKFGSEKYQETADTIQGIEDDIVALKQAQVEWNEQIRNIPIKNIQSYLSTIGNIKTDIQNLIAEQEAMGKTVGADTFNKLVQLSADEAKKLLEQQNLLKNNLKNYAYGSDKYAEIETQIQNIDNSLSDLVQNTIEWNRNILEIPINKLNEVTEQLTLMKEALDDVINDYDTVLSGVSYLLDEEKKKIEEQRDEYSKSVDERIKGLNKEIEGIREIIDALEEQNEARRVQLAVEQAEYDLNKANTEKSVQIIQDGQRQFIADQEAVRQAQQELNEATYQKHLYDLNQQIEELNKEIDALEKERDEKLQSYDDTLEFLDKQAEKWSTIVSSIEGARDMLMSLQYLGNGWDEKILTGNDDAIYNKFYKDYETVFNQSDAYDKQIESNERIADLMSAYVDAFMAGTLSYDKVFKGLKSLSGNIDDKLLALENVTETRNLLGGASVDSILKSLEGQATGEANNYPEYLKLVQQNNNTFAKYAETWNELKGEVAAEKAQLEKQYKELIAIKENSDLKKDIEAQRALLEKQWKELQETKEASTRVASTVRHSDRDGGSAVNVAGEYAIVNSGGLVGYHHSDGSVDMNRPDSTYVHHDGIEGGAIGKLSNDDKIKTLKKMSLKPLKANEVPAILKAGEVVLNNAQQSNLLSNLGKLSNFGKKAESNTVVTLSMGDINLPQVHSGQDFANFITKNLSSAVAQGLSKR